jgi:hypothetical protein
VLQNGNELRDRIVRAAECITSEMLAITLRDNEHRLDVFRATPMVPMLRLLSTEAVYTGNEILHNEV